MLVAVLCHGTRACTLVRLYVEALFGVKHIRVHWFYCRIAWPLAIEQVHTIFEGRDGFIRGFDSLIPAVVCAVEHGPLRPYTNLLFLLCRLRFLLLRQGLRRFSHQRQYAATYLADLKIKLESYPGTYQAFSEVFNDFAANR